MSAPSTTTTLLSVPHFVQGRTTLAQRDRERRRALGEVIDAIPGLPHDGFYPLHRFVRRLVDDC